MQHNFTIRRHVSFPLWNGEPPLWNAGDSNDHPTIDGFLPHAASPTPAVLIFPGGGYARRAEHEAEPVARRFTKYGIAAFVVSYRVAPYRDPVPLLDALRSLRVVRLRSGELNVDPKSIGVMGFSAGGHVAGCAATMFDREFAHAYDDLGRLSARPAFAVLCYPVVSFVKFPHTGSMMNLLGENPDLDRRKALSVEAAVDADTPPIFMWHTADDQSVHVGNVIELSDALSQNEIPFELHVFARGRHGLGLGDGEVGVWPDLAARWLEYINVLPCDG